MEKNSKLSAQVQEQVNKLGSDMIMHDSAALKENDAALQNLKEEIEIQKENRTEAETAAVTGGVSMPAIIRKTRPMVREYKKIRRNDPCPCGAVDENGKPIKYKNCCLASGRFEGYHTV